MVDMRLPSTLSLGLAAVVGALALQVIVLWVLTVRMNRRIRNLENAGAESPSVVEEQTPLTRLARKSRSGSTSRTWAIWLRTGAPN